MPAVCSPLPAFRTIASLTLPPSLVMPRLAIANAFICNEMRWHQTLHNTFIFLTVRYTFNIKANYRLFYLHVCAWVWVWVCECVYTLVCVVVCLRPFFRHILQAFRNDVKWYANKNVAAQKEREKLDHVCVCVRVRDGVSVCMCGVNLFKFKFKLLASFKRRKSQRSGICVLNFWLN